MKKSTLVLFALASGFAVGNLYFIQPLLGAISEDLGTTATQNGWLVTAVQLGYAVGIVLLLPLGDVIARKRLVPFMMTLAGLSQIAIGFSTGYVPLMISLVAVGVTTISGQVLVPLTGELSDDTNRGKNVAFVVSGMIIGILGARILSGTFSDLIGWHLTFTLIGLANMALALALNRAIPVLPEKQHINYLPLVSGTFSLLARNPRVLGTMAVNSFGLIIFSSVWTSITFLLSGEQFNFSTTQIGAWGLFGIVGAIGARNSGRLIDAGKGDLASKVAWVLVAVGMAIGALAEQSLIFLAVQLVIMDASMQAIGITNQTRLISMFPEARSRVNAGYVTVNFLGAALGSALATALWASFGWVGLQLLGTGLALVALLLWVLNRRSFNR